MHSHTNVKDNKIHTYLAEKKQKFNKTFIEVYFGSLQLVIFIVNQFNLKSQETNLKE